MYRIDQRSVENNRNLENTYIVFHFPSIMSQLTMIRPCKYGASTTPCSKLLYDNTRYLLTLTLADKAVNGISLVKELWQLYIPPDSNELILGWSDFAKHLPVLRNATMLQGVLEEALSKKTFNRNIKSVLNLLE